MVRIPILGRAYSYLFLKIHSLHNFCIVRYINLIHAEALIRRQTLGLASTSSDTIYVFAYEFTYKG